MASRSRWPSWILLGGVPAFSLKERLMGGLRCFRSRAEPSPRHPPDQHRQPVAAPGRQIGPAHRSLLSLLPCHDAPPSIEPARVGPRCLREVTHPTAGPLQRFLGGGMCLYAKRLEAGRFCWPSPANGVVRLTGAQLATLLKGLAWNVLRPRPVRRPSAAWWTAVLASCPYRQ